MSSLLAVCHRRFGACQQVLSSICPGANRAFNLVLLVIFLINLVSCDYESLRSTSGLPLGPFHNYSQSKRTHTSHSSRRLSETNEEWPGPSEGPSDRRWQTASKRGRHKHRLNSAAASLAAKSVNEVVRSRTTQPNSHYDPVFASSQEQQTHLSLPSLYTNQSILPRPFLPNARSAVPRPTHHSKKRHHHHHRVRQSEHNKKRPNIIFMLTDDQDIELGSMDYMPKTMKILSEGGVHVKNAYVTTPYNITFADDLWLMLNVPCSMCCPSRSSILTGLYVHNHNVYTNGENCSSVQWQHTHERRTFATYLQESGYRTAFFGKYLNEYNGSYIPPGWSDWSALVRNSRYYNYTLNVNGDRVRHGANYELDYYPDLILNDSLQYMRYSKRFFSSKPYLMVMSFPSPHGPEDAAPQFQDMFLSEKGHRTPSWNHAPNPDMQWILRHTRRMAPIHQQFTDFLNAKRLQTLQSIDEAVYQIYTELKNLGELDNTYIVYTSDHGYHLGQFGLVKGKAMPFEFDIRVPFYVRGPGIPQDRVLPQIVLNIDIAPTLIDIAGLKVPPHMDGLSFLPHIRQLNSSLPNQKVKVDSRSKSKSVQRDSFLIEKGKFKAPNSVDGLLIPIIGKRQWLQLECQKPEYQSPCKLYQKFECYQDEQGSFRIRKCHRANGRKWRKSWRDSCICGDSNRSARTVSTRNFDDALLTPHGLSNDVRPRKSKKHQRQGNAGQSTNDRRWKRSNDAISALLAMSSSESSDPSGFDVEGVYKLKKFIDLARTPTSFSFVNMGESVPSKLNRANTNDISNITTSQLVSILGTDGLSDLSNYTDFLNRTFCTVTRANLSIECTEEIYSDQDSWKEKKQFVDSAITQLQRRLFELRGIRRFMNDKRPKNASRNDLCQCNGDQESLDTFAQMARQPHPRRLVERRFMKHLHRKKWRRKHEKKMRRKEKFENTACEMAASEQMNCFTHDNDHWKPPPFWTDGPFCFCQNSLNNSFWCMRTINETHNLLYCEFVTGFITYYDLIKDPFQLRNAIYDLEMSTVEELSAELARLKSCAGSAQCSSARSNARRPNDRPAKKSNGNEAAMLPDSAHSWRHSSRMLSQEV